MSRSICETLRYEAEIGDISQGLYDAATGASALIEELLEALTAMVADHEAIQCKPWPSYHNAAAALEKYGSRT